MTRPTDASIARAFWEEMEETVEAHYTPTLHEFLCRVKRRAEVLEFDAESPAGTAEPVEHYWLCCGSLNFHEHHRPVCQATPEICRWGTADEHAAWQQSRPDIVFKFPQKVTTSPERVQIPAESEHDAAALEIGRKAWADVPDAATWQREIRGTEPAKLTCTIPTCRAEMRPGLQCSSLHCGLKEATT